jgi:low temperature requirement protein LtrA
VIVLGIILIAVGAILTMFGRREAESLAIYGGALVFLGGCVLFLIGILATAHVDTSAWRLDHAAVLAMAIPPMGHRLAPELNSDPKVPVAGSAVDRQPVIVAFLVAAVPIVAAFVLQVLDEGGVGVPAWLRSLLVGVGALTTGLAALWARSRVTPTALPRLDEGTLLVPMVESEDV